MPIKPFASERGVCRSRNIANVAARIKRGWLIWCENWARKLEKRGRQTDWESLGSRARGCVATWEESPDQRPWNDVSRIQIVKENSPRAGGFSLSISSSVYGSLASCVSLVFFLKPRTPARFDAPEKPRRLRVAGAVCRRDRSPAWWLCNLISGLFSPSALLIFFLTAWEGRKSI